MVLSKVTAEKRPPNETTCLMPANRGFHGSWRPTVAPAIAAPATVAARLAQARLMGPTPFQASPIPQAACTSAELTRIVASTSNLMARVSQA